MSADGTIDRHVYRRWFVAIVVAAGLLRVLYVLVAKTGDELLGDQIYYSNQAITIANGDGFTEPFRPGRPAADHAPLTALVLAPVSWSDTDAVLVQRLWMASLGTGVVAGVGLLARWLLGRRASLLAAALAAVYANLWMNDALVMSETLAAVGVVAVLFSAYVYDLGRRPLQAVALGTAIGLAGLARAELLLYGPLLALPLTLLAPGEVAWWRRVAHLGIAAVAAAALVSPWVVRNLAVFEEPTLMSTQDGQTLVGANCAATYEGPGRGFWDLDCVEAVDVAPGADQSQRSAALRDAAADYVGDHLGDVPGVVAARLGRGLNLWQNETMVEFNAGEGREPWASRIGIGQYWMLLVAATLGWWRWPGRQPRWPLAVSMGIAVLVIMAFYGLPRFRIPAEVPLVVLAAGGLDVAWRAVATRRPHRAPSPPPTAPTP